MSGTSVAEHNGHFFLADLTEFLAVGDNHGERFFLIRQIFCANLSDRHGKGKSIA
jgi:hypothetical protein